MLIELKLALKMSTIPAASTSVQQLIRQMSNGHQQLEEVPQIRPIVLSGPSGSGKSTLIQKLFAKHPDCFQFSVSHTTRQPRAGEENGKHYWFVTVEKLTQMVEDGEFLEHTQFAANHYGTSKAAVQQVIEGGRIPILDVDVRGVRNLKAAGLKPQPKFIYIRPPSMDKLRERLISRKTDDEQRIALRLAEAAEAEDYAKADGAYDAIIVNDDLETAFGQFDSFLTEDVELANHKS